LFSLVAGTTIVCVKTAHFLAFPLLVALSLAGCGTFELREAAPPGEPHKAAAPLAEERDELAPRAAASEGLVALEEQPPSAEPQPAREGRARVYSGFCRLVVDEVEQARRQLEELAAASGGYVESVNASAVSLRVPAARFREAFAAVQKLGEVAAKSIETYDVSDTLRDQQTRLELAEKSRERLYQLLERTGDVKERLAILREIRRLTEEIERVRQSVELLKNQVALSRITVELQARRPEIEARAQTIPFPWIADLSPLYPSLSKPAGKAVPALSDDFAVFSKERRFRAESPEGTRVRLGSTRNSPRGGEDFWQKALLYHLGPRYRKAEAVQEGAFRGVLFTSKDSRPYAYLVAVRARGKRLDVFEAFFPDPEACERRLDGIRTALKGIQ
jgi:hypothetical protein